MTTNAVSTRRSTRPAYLLTPGTILAKGTQPLVLRPEHLQRQIAIMGGSGGGKSMLLESLGRQLLSQGQGFSFIDPHGDGARGILQYASVCPELDPNRFLYLRAGTFSLDPFANLAEDDRESELWATADLIVNAFLRGMAAADAEVMVRQRRWLKNAIVACGTLTPRGTYAGLGKLLTFLVPGAPDFSRLFADIEANLPDEVRVDYHKLIATQRPRDQEGWVESAINRVRETLSPPVRRMLSLHARSIDLRAIILQRMGVLLDLAESKRLSRSQCNTIGGLYLNFLQSEARQLGEELPKDDRVPHFLIVDEAENFIGEDLRMGFGEWRKFRLSCCLTFQNLSCLQKGDLDLQSKVISQCGLAMTFQQGDPYDLEYLARAFGIQTLDFEPAVSEQALPDGFDWVPTKSVTIGVTEQHTRSRSESESTTRTTSTQRQTSASIQLSVSRALSCSEGESVSTQESEATGLGRTEGTSHTETNGASEGQSETRSATNSTGSTVSESWGEGSSESCSHGVHEGQSTSHGVSRPLTADRTVLSDNDGRSEGLSDTQSRASTENYTLTQGQSGSRSLGAATGWNSTKSASQSDATSESASVVTTKGRGSGHGQSKSKGESKTDGLAVGLGAGSSEGTADGLSRGTTTGTSAAKGESASVTFGTTPIPRYRFEIRRNGHLLMSVNDQLWRLMKTMATLPDRVALVKVKGMTELFLLRTHEVVDPWVQRYGRRRSEAWRRDDVERFLARMRAAHGCFFDPRAVQAQSASARLATRTAEVEDDPESPIA